MLIGVYNIVSPDAFCDPSSRWARCPGCLRELHHKKSLSAFCLTTLIFPFHFLSSPYWDNLFPLGKIQWHAVGVAHCYLCVKIWSQHYSIDLDFKAVDFWGHLCQGNTGEWDRFATEGPKSIAEEGGYGECRYGETPGSLYIGVFSWKAFLHYSRVFRALWS